VAKNVPGYLKGSFGNQVVIKHNAHEKTRYCHMKYGSITVVEGQQVSKGQVIGYMGATGNTTQPHLHLQYEVDGVAVDPIGIIGADLPGIYANLLVDGSWGDKTTKALQKALGVAADGNFGPISIKALQTKLGVRADGVYGPITKEALQTYLGVVADGDIGPITVKALQTKLNNGSF